MSNWLPGRSSSARRVSPRKDSIPHDTYEQFIRLFVAQEGRLRAFLRTLVPSLGELDEVMQETSLVAWQKFSQFEPGTDFLAWVATIARFEALRWRRDRAADRLVFSEQLCELLADEALALKQAIVFRFLADRSRAAATVPSSGRACCRTRIVGWSCSWAVVAETGWGVMERGAAAILSGGSFGERFPASPVGVSIA